MINLRRYLLTGTLVFVICLNALYAQVYDYAFPYEQRSLFLGFGNPQNATVAPQTIARNMINTTQYDDILNASQLGMSLSATQSSRGVTVTTTGAILSFANSSGSITCSTTIGASRPVVSISGIVQSSGSFVLAPNPTVGSAFINFVIPGNVVRLKIRVTSDGLIMIQNLWSSVIYPTYSPSFYPGYVGVGNPDSTLLKYDFSYLLLDNYGGFGVYLVDEYYNSSTKVLYSNQGTFPQYTFKVSSQKVFWTAICPPRNYNWADTANKRFYAYWTATSADNNASQSHKEQRNQTTVDLTDPNNGDYISQQPYPNYSTFSAFNTNRTYNGTGYPDGAARYADIVMGSPEVLMYDTWNLSYHPRTFIFNGLPQYGWDYFDSVVSNAHNNGKKIIFYTNPSQFYTGSPYVSGSTYYRDLTTPQNDWYPNGVPYINSMDQRYPPSGVTVYDPPGNPEGYNISDYLSRVDSLSNNGADGVYVDGGLYPYNIPQSYVLIRRIRQHLGDGKIIVMHSTPRPGNDGYLPQIDTYASYAMFGEGRNQTASNQRFYRYFEGTYNISNTVGILMGNYSWTTYPQSIIDLAKKTNLRLRAFTDGSTYFPRTSLVYPDLNNYWQNQPSDFQTAFSTYAGTENPAYYIEYTSTQGNNAINVSSDLFFTGDFNGDGLTDVLRIDTRTWDWWVRLSEGTAFGGERKWIPNWQADPTKCRVLVGDFDGDGKCDVVKALYGPQNSNQWDWQVMISDGTKFNWSPSNPWSIWQWQTTDKTVAGDFNGDHRADILKCVYNQWTWEVVLSHHYSTYDAFDSLAVWQNWQFYSDDNILSFKRDNNLSDDVLKNVTDYGLSESLYSTGSSFTGWNQVSWPNGSASDLIFAGNFYDQSGRYPNGDLLRIAADGTLSVAIGDGTQFSSPAPAGSVVRNAGDKFLTGDFDGDGITDLVRIEAATGNFYLLKNYGYNNPNVGWFQGAQRWDRKMYKIIGPSDPASPPLPKTFSMDQNFPNPFNPTTTISFNIPSTSFVSLKVFDVLGREVATIVAEEMSPGSYSRQWNAAKISSGIYFYRMQAGSFTETKKLILLK